MDILESRLRWSNIEKSVPQKITKRNIKLEKFLVHTYTLTRGHNDTRRGTK